MINLGREKTVRILIRNGADIYAKDIKGRTPRDYARKSRKIL